MTMTTDAAAAETGTDVKTEMTADAVATETEMTAAKTAAAGEGIETATVANAASGETATATTNPEAAARRETL